MNEMPFVIRSGCAAELPLYGTSRHFPEARGRLRKQQRRQLLRAAVSGGAVSDLARRPAARENDGSPVQGQFRRASRPDHEPHLVHDRSTRRRGGRTSRRGPCARWRSPRLSVTHHFRTSRRQPKAGCPLRFLELGRRVRTRRHAARDRAELNAEIGAALANPTCANASPTWAWSRSTARPKSSANSCNRK